MSLKFAPEPVLKPSFESDIIYCTASTRSWISKFILATALFAPEAFGQSTKQDTIIDLSKLASADGWAVFNRTVKPLSAPTRTNSVYFNEHSGQGIAWIPSLKLSEGTIDVDVKGRDVRGKSFVGLAFGGKDAQHYEAVYLRPFNFQADTPEGRSRAIQYVASPTHEWQRLRNEHPGKYEAAIGANVAPAGWVHLRIQLDKQTVRVFINGSKEPRLTAKRLTTDNAGWVGLWVGNNSDGAFANLRIAGKEKNERER